MEKRDPPPKYVRKPGVRSCHVFRNTIAPQQRPTYVLPPLVLDSGVASLISQRNVYEIKTSSEKRKNKLQGLNEKLANHLEKVRFLEAENKHLRELLGKSKLEFNIDIIKDLYHGQLDDLKPQLEDKNNELAATKSRNESLEEEEVADLNPQLHHLQDMNDQLQLTVDGLHDEVVRHSTAKEKSKGNRSKIERQIDDLRDRNDILDGHLNKVRTELENETTQRLAEATRGQAIEDEVAFLTDIHATEMKEYQAMLSKKQNLPDFRETWKVEFGGIAAQLTAEYETQLQLFTAKLEARHKAQLQDLRPLEKTTPADTQKFPVSKHLRLENKELMGKLSELEDTISSMKNKVKSLEKELEMLQDQQDMKREEYQSEINDLRLTMEAILNELRKLMDAKLHLEMGIAAYCKLIEGEENRLGNATMVPAIVDNQTECESLPAAKPLADVLTGKIRVKRTRSGSVSIIELDPDGEYIELEDTTTISKGATNLKNWTLTQIEEGGKAHTHTFTDGNVFSSGKLVKIWGAKYGDGQGDITSSTVPQWCALSTSSTCILKDIKNKENAILAITFAL